MQGDGGHDSVERAHSPKRESDPRWVILGRVSGLFGVKGWVKIYSHTSPKTNILQFPGWYLKQSGGWKFHRLAEGRAHGKGIIARLAECRDRDQATALLEAEIAVPREQLPKTGSDEFYWTDLEGLAVETLDGVALGRVDHLFETGANDVVVVEGDRRRLIPFTQEAVREVDLERGLMRVDWDPEF